MRIIATQTLASVLAALLPVSCGTVREGRQPNIEEHVFLPRAPRVVASPVVDELELRRAIFNAVKDKVLAGQTGRVVINLEESSASVPQLMREFTQRRGEVRQLSEVLVVRKGAVTRIYP